MINGHLVEKEAVEFGLLKTEDREPLAQFGRVGLHDVLLDEGKQAGDSRLGRDGARTTDRRPPDRRRAAVIAG